jgi:hypothetical protein
MAITSREPVRLSLPTEVKAQGVLRDKAGRTIPGARVAPWQFSRSLRDSSVPAGQGDLKLLNSEALPEATTDNEGRFTLPNLPAGSWVSVWIGHAELKGMNFIINTGAQDGVTEIPRGSPQDDSFPIYRSPMNVAVERLPSGRIKVIDHAGRPVASGGVEIIGGSRFHWQGDVNEHGEAWFPIQSPGRFRFRYGADPLHPGLGLMVIAEVATGEESPVVMIRLQEPRWVSGHVVDAETGKGIVGVYISYMRQTDTAKPDISLSSMAVSIADGAFRIPVAAGRGQVRVASGNAVFGYLAPTLRPRSTGPNGAADTALLNVPASGDLAPIKLALSRDHRRD